MAGQLIPPPDMAPTLPKGLTFEQRILVWVDLMNAAERFLLVGLRRRIGPNGDLRAAYREWHRKQMEEKDRTFARIAARMRAAGMAHGR